MPGPSSRSASPTIKRPAKSKPDPALKKVMDARRRALAAALALLSADLTSSALQPIKVDAATAEFDNAAVELTAAVMQYKKEHNNEQPG